MQDRLAELKRSSLQKEEGFRGEDLEKTTELTQTSDEEGARDDEGQAEEPKIGGGEMNNYLKTVEEVKKRIDFISSSLPRLDAKFSYSLSLVLGEEMTKTKGEINQIIQDINKAALEVKTRLERMKRENDSLNRDNDEESEEERKRKLASGGTERRMRETLQGSLSRKFLELMRTFQEQQACYRARFREKAGRQLRIVAPEATDQEIDELVENGEATEVFTQKLIQLNEREAAEALGYVKERHEEMKMLEKSIMELHQLFVDMQLLVETQGELVDQIAYSVDHSQDYVEESNVVLAQAYQYQKGRRVKILLAVVGCLVCAGIIVGVVLAVYYTKGGGKSS